MRSKLVSTLRFAGAIAATVSASTPLVMTGPDVWVAAASDAWLSLGLFAVAWAVESVEVRRR